ncbi:hypothetical protein BRC77_03385 [Halobacteriales archaeon QH_8_64_26]|nr:MAG: hypothetical protein BRC77_03385 [Halobacteriales archaeon QH_8_64_26]
MKDVDHWVARSEGETYALVINESITIARGSCEKAMAGVGTTNEDTDGTDGTDRAKRGRLQ